MIELLVVLAIVAVLASLLLPVISSVKESGNSVKCTSNLRQIGEALNLYCGDNNNSFPPLEASDGTNWDKAAILPYLPGRNRAGQNYQVQNAVFLCPSAKYNGYSLNNVSRTYTATDCLAGPKPDYSYKVANSRNALNSVTGNLLLFDGCQYQNQAYTNVNATWSNVSGSSDLQANQTTSTYIDYRHRKAFHGLYADGHVDTIKRADASRLVTVQSWRMSDQ